MYSVTQERIETICLSVIEATTQDELRAALTFLTLRSEDIDKVLDESGIPSTQKLPDLPVWEHNKRFARYTLKPLIQHEGQYYWEPYGPYKTSAIWSGNITDNGTLPVNMKKHNIDRVLRAHKESIEKAVVHKAFEIIKCFTSFVGSEIYLHKKDKEFNHPLDLGDYDVLAYIQEKNLLLNIECKDLLPPFCMKDSRSQQDRVLGNPGKPGDLGYAGKVERRHDYLLDNMERIMRVFSAPPFHWQFDNENTPTVISLFVSRQLTLWTHYPTREVNVKFLQIDTLKAFLRSLTE